ncbi:hypothetical protein [Actinomadura macrotermitis]|uniref:Uncharacterized protein n=1 Tax=Actinomadura macrotermitis TaxID=2585200 RepID=A0A7K0BR95_9ACTN|nr:hypothetical protein [Actinomadura macrotermitis]MQY03671.1 hypothetical protein [Actinomadura macrotermitis]
MNMLQRATVLGFSMGALAIAAPAAMADTHHEQHKSISSPWGAAKADLIAHTKDGKDGKHGDGVFYGKFFKAAGPKGAVSASLISAAD